MKRLLSLLAPLFLLFSCDLEKDIEVELPVHEPQLVVECYLEPGKPFRATVFESAGYFEEPEPPLVPDAQVSIMHNGREIKLAYKPDINERNRRFYTHTSEELMQGKPGDMFELKVTDSKGRKVSGFTTILPAVPIEEIEWKFNDKDKAYLLTSFQDEPGKANFYRYITHRDSLNTDPERGFTLDDDLYNGKKISLGSAYDYEDGDTLVISLFHIEKAYYEYLNSVDEAKSANGNPFGQPSRIRSSVQGGIGIFTNLAYDRKEVIIKK